MPFEDIAARHCQLDLVKSVRQRLEPVQTDVTRLGSTTLDLPQEGRATAARRTVDVGVEAQVQGPTYPLEL